MDSIGVVCNFFQEANALPGFLESVAEAGFDDVAFLHAGPGGRKSDDGSIEIIEKWGARIEYGSIDEGFGVTRTKAVRMSKCEWVMILDADERFHRVMPQMVCGPDLSVSVVGRPFDHMEWLRSLLNNCNYDAIRSYRRHWHDFTWKRPTQDWTTRCDWQLRIVRNVEHIQYSASPKMHERLIDTRIGNTPQFCPESGGMGPYHDHYHCFFKPMEADQRAHDIRIYDALDQGREVPQQ